MAPLDPLYASQSRLLRESVRFIGSVMALLLISVNDCSFPISLWLLMKSVSDCNFLLKQWDVKFRQSPSFAFMLFLKKSGDNR